MKSSWQFWQEVSTFDPETETKKNEFICYSVYKVTKESWLDTLKNYMKSVLPSLPLSPLLSLPPAAAAGAGSAPGISWDHQK